MSNRHPRKKCFTSNYNVPEIMAMASGRWEEILASAGIPRECLAGRNGRPCPRCGGRDRFAPMPDLERRGAVLCRNCHNGSTEPRCGDGLATLRWWLGCSIPEALQWLRGFLGIDGQWAPKRPPVERRLVIADSSGGIDWDSIARDRVRSMRPEWLVRAADLLGLPPEPLARLGTGWDAAHRATSWPMRDADGRAIGIRLRCPRTGRKWALRGSRAGLFFDVAMLERVPVERVWIAEGPTDTAAILSIGLDAVGVPSAGGGSDLLRAVGVKLGVREAVLVADADGPGRAGAERLAESLVAVAPVRIVAPVGAKDARAWVLAGAGADAFEAEALRAPVRRLILKGVSHG